MAAWLAICILFLHICIAAKADDCDCEGRWNEMNDRVDKLNLSFQSRVQQLESEVAQLHKKDKKRYSE